MLDPDGSDRVAHFEQAALEFVCFFDGFPLFLGSPGLVDVIKQKDG
jgi:hypothetical protein